MSFQAELARVKGGPFMPTNPIFVTEVEALAYAEQSFRHHRYTADYRVVKSAKTPTHCRVAGQLRRMQVKEIK